MPTQKKSSSRWLIGSALAAGALIAALVVFNPSNIGYQETKIAGLNAVMYNAGKGKPVIIAFPGLGEDGIDINKLFVHGPAKFLRDGWKPDGYTVIHIQPVYGWIPPSTVQKIINEIQSSLSPPQIHLTGLSAGAASIFDYLAKTPSNTIASIVVMSYKPMPDQQKWNQYPPAWAFAGDRDADYASVMKTMVGALTNQGKTSLLTIYPGGHCCWNDFYNPAYKPNGKNIYEWMISHGGQVTKPDPVDPTPDPKPEPTVKGKRIMLPLVSGGIYVRNWTTATAPRPGDTLIAPTGTKQIFLANFSGTAKDTIVIMPERSTDTIGRPGNYIFSIENARYFKVSGFKINGGATHKGFNLALGKGAENYLVENYYSRYGVNGIKASWNPVANDPSTYAPNTIDSIAFRHIRILDTETEGMYIGNTLSVTATTKPVPSRVNKLLIDDAHTLRTKWDGIQTASASNVTITNSSVREFGTAKQASQQAGFLIGGYVTTTRIENLVVENGSGAGITIFGRGKIHVKGFSVSGAHGGIYADDYTDGTFGLPAQELIFENGTITGTSGPLDIEIRNAKGTARKTTYINVQAKTISDRTGGVLTPKIPPVTNPIYKTFSDADGTFELLKDSTWRKK